MNFLFLFSSQNLNVIVTVDQSLVFSFKTRVLIPSRFPLERPTRCLASTPHDREHHHEAPGGLATRFGGGTDDEVRRRPSAASPAFSIFSSFQRCFAASRPRWFHRHNCKAASSSTNPAAMVTGNRCFVAFLIRRQAAGQPPCAPAACAALRGSKHPTGSPVVHQPRVQRHSSIGGIMMRAPALMSDLSDCKCAETRAQLRHLSAAAALLAIA